ncbi:MAG: ImmA/IrrE family metallo-endopeptidase [Elainellaceae cyanobacterium]
MVQPAVSTVSRRAKMMANQMLVEVWHEAGFPVDPVTIAKRLGIHVLETDLPDPIAGALLKESGKDPIIVIHYEDSNQRKRFTCAHELGHYSWRVAEGTTGGEYNYVDLRDGPDPSRQDDENRFADEFAANLLMPASELSRLQRQGESMLSAMVYFGVSEAVLAYRLKVLNISPDAFVRRYR